MYYELIEDDYKGRKEDIGDIMLTFNENLYNETGLSLEISCAPTKEEIEKYFSERGMKALNEDVLWKNMNDNQKCSKFATFLSKIKAQDNVLIIIDPYIFPNKYDNNYLYLLSKIIKASNSKKIKIITSNSRNEELEKNFIKKFDKGYIEIKYSKKFHDRFWLSEDGKGFVVGTSLNGIGHKISLIDYLDNKDVNELLTEVKKLFSI